MDAIARKGRDSRKYPGIHTHAKVANYGTTMHNEYNDSLQLDFNKRLRDNSADDINFILSNADRLRPPTRGNKRSITQAMNKHMPKRLAMCQRQQKLQIKMDRDEERTMRKCKRCGSEMTFEDHSCVNCAEVQEETWLVMPTIDEMRYKIQTHQIPCAYKRINHFNEKLAQLQAKEKTIISEDVYTRIRAEVAKCSFLSIATLTPQEVKRILKKLSLSKYYEHVNFITNTLNGYELPTLYPEQEEKLRQMFAAVQEPFAKHCPPGRKNFLNYSYILTKMCQLLEYDWLLDMFSELKSREKLYEQDIIWKDICTDLGWEYIPSI